MHTGLRKVVKVDHPTRKNVKRKEDCCCTAEEPVENAIEVPAAKPTKDWQKEEPPYYHRDIF